MKNHHNRDNKKIILKLEKPHLLHILSNKKYNYKLNPYDHNKYTPNNVNSFSPFLKEKNHKNNTNTLNILPNYKINNNSPTKNKNKHPRTIMKTSPLKFQYKKIPFDKVKGYKIKLPNPFRNKRQNNNYKKKVLNIYHINYPLISEHNHSSIQTNKDTIEEKFNKRSYSYLDTITDKQNTLNSQNNTLTQKTLIINKNLNHVIKQTNIIIKNKENNNKKPLYYFIESKSSSIGSKLETREESGHFLKSRSKSSINSPQLFSGINLNKNINILNYKINNYDTEIKIPKLNIKFNKNENTNLNNDYKNNERYGVNEGDNNSDIANFEFSD